MTPRTLHVLALALVLLAVVRFGGPPLRNADWGWHLATGELALQQRSLPTTNTLTLAGYDQPVPPVFWGFDVLLALTHRLAGLPGLLALKLLLVATLYLGLHLLLIRHGLPPLSAATLTCALASVAHIRLILRPHLASMILLLALAAILLETRRRLRWFAALPPLFVLWTNLHPAALLGLGVLGAFTLGSWLPLLLTRSSPTPHAKRLALALPACTVATVATPAGLSLWPWLWAHRHMYAEQGITELRPFDLSQTLDQRALLVALLVLALARRPRLSDLAPYAMPAAYVLFTLRTSRFFPHTLHLLALALAASRPTPLRRLPLLGLAAFALWQATTSIPLSRQPLHPEFHTPAIADFLLDHPPPEPLFNSNRLGGYLTFRFLGDPLAFWDGRQPLYRGLPSDWDGLDQRFQFATAVIANRESPLPLEVAGAESRWRLIAFDDTARLYVEDARAPDWSHLGFHHLRFRWRPVSSSEIGLDADVLDPQGALRELEPQRARDPDGYFTNLALAHTLFRLGRTADARAAAERAAAARATPVIRQVLSALR